MQAPDTIIPISEIDQESAKSPLKQSVESSTQSVESLHPKGYNNYGPYLKAKYPGHRVFKVIVDGGFTCPNRDGSKGFGGCTYCNVDSFTPSVSRNAPTVRQQVIEGMERARKGNKADKFIIYFQPNTNTYAPAHYLKMMYDEALSYGTEDIVGLSVGTRPDCIDAEKIPPLPQASRLWPHAK